MVRKSSFPRPSWKVEEEESTSHLCFCVCHRWKSSENPQQTRGATRKRSEREVLTWWACQQYYCYLIRKSTQASYRGTQASLQWAFSILSNVRKYNVVRCRCQALWIWITLPSKCRRANTESNCPKVNDQGMAWNRAHLLRIWTVWLIDPSVSLYNLHVHQLEYTAPEILFTLPNPNPYPTCALIQISSAVNSNWSYIYKRINCFNHWTVGYLGCRQTEETVVMRGLCCIRADYISNLSNRTLQLTTWKSVTRHYNYTSKIWCL